MEGVWFDYRLAGRLRDEAPAAYKNIRAVLRAQKDLVKVTRTVDGRTPTLLVEAKWGDVEVDRSLKCLKARFPAADAWQISATGTQDYVSPEGIRVAPALARLGQLA